MQKITFTNPVAEHGADPWVIRDGNDYYYCYSGGNGVCVAKLTDLSKINGKNGVKVYTAPEGTMYSREYWAPELHKIHGVWYIYVAADDGDNFHHRMYVLRGTDADPTKPFEMMGKITDSTDKWAIDGTVLQYNGQCWFIWSGWEGDENIAQNLYIAHMSNPWTIDSERVLLSKPDLEWERRGSTGDLPKINEGPVALIKDGTVHIVYSASGSWCDEYCLGILTCRDGNFMCQASWEKASAPILTKADKAFGPGHCSFTTAADGATWVIYHANLVSGTSWGGRDVRIQPVTWNGDMPVIGVLKSGTLIPGTPVSPDTELEIWC